MFLPAAAPNLDPFQLYLVFLNVGTFVVGLYDWSLRKRRGEGAGVSGLALSLLCLLGGAAGGALAFLLLDRHTSKQNSLWHILSLVSLLGWGLALAMVYGPSLDLTALSVALARDHTRLLGYLGAVNAVTFLVFVVDKLVAVWNGRGPGRNASRIPEIVLLLLAFVGGSLGGLLAMLVVRHKIRTPAFFVSLPLMLVEQALLVAYLVQLGV